MYFCRREHYMSPKIKLDFYNWQNGFDGLSSPIIRAYTAALTKFRVSAKMIQLNSLLKAICQHFLLVSTGRFQLLLPLRSFTVLQAANDLSCLGYKEGSISRFSLQEMYLPNSSALHDNLCNELRRPYERSSYRSLADISLTNGAGKSPITLQIYKSALVMREKVVFNLGFN